MKDRDICELIRNHFKEDDWDDGHSWPPVVMVEEEFYMKRTETGHFGNPDCSYYEHVDRSKMIKWFYPRLCLDELMKENR